MEPITQHLEIDWPVTALYHFMNDTDAYPLWRKRVLHACWLDHDKHTPGVRMLELYEVMGRSVPVRVKLTGVTAYRKREMVIVNRKTKTYSSVEYKAVGAHTVLTLTVWCEADDERLSKRVSAAVARQHFDDLLHLKALLEEPILAEVVS